VNLAGCVVSLKSIPIDTEIEAPRSRVPRKKKNIYGINKIRRGEVKKLKSKRLE
jgi:hypothetical protein